MAGKRQRRVHDEGGRFDLREIATRVQRRMIARGVEPKVIQEKLGMKAPDWTKKTSNNGSTFTIGELSRIAAFLEAPPGWPFIDEYQADILAGYLAPPQRPGEPESPSEASRPPAQPEQRKVRGGKP
jgi:hypothetical protein